MRHRRRLRAFSYSHARRCWAFSNLMSDMMRSCSMLTSKCPSSCWCGKGERMWSEGTYVYNMLEGASYGTSILIKNGRTAMSVCPPEIKAAITATTSISISGARKYSTAAASMCRWESEGFKFSIAHLYLCCFFWRLISRVVGIPPRRGRQLYIIFYN